MEHSTGAWRAPLKLSTGAKMMGAVPSQNSSIHIKVEFIVATYSITYLVTHKTT